MCRKDKIKEIGRRFLRGASSLSITEKRDYYRHVPQDVSSLTAKRWADIGARLRKATDKVVGSDSQILKE